MKKIKILSLVLCLSIVLLSVPAYASTDEIDTTPTLTANEYVNWLETKKVNSTLEERSNINKTITQFQALSKKDQVKFLNYISDEKVIEDVLSFFLSDNKNDVIIYNSDIVVKKNSLVKEILVSPFNLESDEETIYHSQAYFYPSVEILGITVFETMSTVRYDHTDSEILEILWSEHYVRKAFVIGLSVTIGSENEWISGTRAYASAVFTGSFFYEGLGIVYGSVRSTVWGSASMDNGGYFTEL